MATSSITYNFVISGEAVERFADAIEESEHRLNCKLSVPTRSVSDEAELDEILDAWQELYGTKH